MSILDRLREGGVLLDGAMGTSLMEKGAVLAPEVALASLAHPDLVRGVHRGFLQAGCQVLQTNTFAANAIRLRACGHDHSVRELNSAAVSLARAEAQAFAGVFVAGNIGPARTSGEGAIPPEPGVLRRAYRDQAHALLDAGVDLLSLETFNDSRDALQAIAAIRELEDTPLTVSLTFERAGKTFCTAAGEPLGQALAKLVKAGADAVGVNCASGTADTLLVVAELANAFQVPFIAKPNAGLPERVDGRWVYSQTPAEFAADMSRAAQLGAAAVGGCCGADASYIDALGALL